MADAASCVQRLAELAGVEAVPTPVVDWPAVEAAIRMPLPEDYKLLVDSLPDGWFRDFVRVIRPSRSPDRKIGFLDTGTLNRLEDMRRWRAEGYGIYPYPIYPEPGGLLPWGTSIRRALFFWLTEPADPRRWPVITASAEWDYWDRFDGTVCEFLVQVAAGQYDASGFADGPIREVTDFPEGYELKGEAVDLSAREPVFRPIAGRSHRPPGGPRSDFWIQRARELQTERAPINEFPALREFLGSGRSALRQVDWADVQARLGHRLPTDYRSFVDTYGPGTFGDVRITAPGADGDMDLFALLNRKWEQVRALTRHEWDTPIYPEPGGIISWGETVGGYTCAWAPTSADPDEWSVVVIAPSQELNSYTFKPGLSFSGMLKEHKEQTDRYPGLDLGIIPPRDVSEGSVTFIPYRSNH